MTIARIKMTPLQGWAATRIGVGEAALTRQQIACYQLQKLRETVSWAETRSLFYRQRLRAFTGSELSCLEDLRRLPFTTAGDIRQYGPQLLCVSQDDISRVASLDSSGTTGPAKRLYFTPADQEITVGFFRYGLAALTGAGDRVLILLPGERPGSVGDLLVSALGRLGAKPIPHGPVGDIPGTLAVMTREAVDCLIGVPSQVLALARWSAAAGQSVRLKSVLLSTDHVPAAVVAALKRLWGCEVFGHYGMTELGLGGGTECAAHAGYHLHEPDFYFEIVDPLTGEVLPEGSEGEVVVTTLTRRGMPLLRYRTGDISSLLPGTCACGATLRRMAKITARVNGQVALVVDRRFAIADLDEALFAIDGVINFTAAVDRLGQATKLAISVLTPGRPEEVAVSSLYDALDTVPAIRQGRRTGHLTVTVRVCGCSGNLASDTAKRTIAQWEGTDGH